MIDAINSPGPWREEICNKTPAGQVDYSYADPNHRVINPLQSQFASELMEQQGGDVITKYVYPNETRAGAFETQVFKVSDYPQFVNGGEVTLRAINIDNAKFTASDSAVFLNGSLINKTAPALAWFYISGPKEVPEGQANPVFEKRMAGLWASGLVTDSDFYDALQNTTLAGPAPGQGGTLPHWLKAVAGWWYEGRISDETFQELIRYLVSEKIVS